MPERLDEDPATSTSRPSPSPDRAPQAPTSSTCSAGCTRWWRSARPMPLSTSVMVNRDEVLDLLDETIERLPDELRAARWLLKEREEYLAKVRREGEDILDQARTRAERMVQRTEVVKASEARARKIVETAADEASRLKNEVEDFCDQKLASFEIVLERTMKMVGGRAPEAAGLAQHRRRAGGGPRGPAQAEPEPDAAGRVRPGPRVAPVAQSVLRIGITELRRRPGHPARRSACRCRSPGWRSPAPECPTTPTSRSTPPWRSSRVPSPSAARCRSPGRPSAAAASTTSAGPRQVELGRGVRGAAGRRRDLSDRRRLRSTWSRCVRDAALLNLPLAPLCRPDCDGPRPRGVPGAGGAGTRRRRRAAPGPPVGGPRRAPPRRLSPGAVRRVRDSAATLSRLRSRPPAAPTPRPRR